MAFVVRLPRWRECRMIIWMGRMIIQFPGSVWWCVFPMRIMMMGDIVHIWEYNQPTTFLMMMMVMMLMMMMILKTIILNNIETCRESWPQQLNHVSLYHVSHCSWGWSLSEDLFEVAFYGMITHLFACGCCFFEDFMQYSCIYSSNEPLKIKKQNRPKLCSQPRIHVLPILVDLWPHFSPFMDNSSFFVGQSSNPFSPHSMVSVLMCQKYGVRQLQSNVHPFVHVNGNLTDRWTDSEVWPISYICRKYFGENH